jgi:hypothetical protein
MAIEGFLCHECIGDEYLKREIRRRYKVQLCSGCTKRRKALVLQELGIALVGVLRKHFVKTGSHPWDSGDELNHIVQEILTVVKALHIDKPSYRER